MPPYAVEDFEPSNFKFLSRVRLVTVAAGIAARTYASIAERDHGVQNAISVKDDRIEAFVKEYFNVVARFKIRHGYIPGERINQPKIAGLLLRSLSNNGWENFFSRRSKKLSDDFMTKMYYEFAYQLMCGVLYIEDGAMPDEMVRDFYISMHQNQFMIDEWSCWSMTAILKAFGKEDSSSQE